MIFYTKIISHKDKTVFCTPVDFHYYLRLLKKYQSQFNICIYGFCILPKEAHLVVSLRQKGHALLFQQIVSQSYSAYFNAKYGGIKYIWQKTCVYEHLDSYTEFFDFLKYIEFLPVSGNLAQTPQQYAYSSCAFRVLSGRDSFLEKSLPEFSAQKTAENCRIKKPAYVRHL